MTVKHFADWKPAPRIKASKHQWAAWHQQIRGLKCSLCNEEPATSLHHLVYRSASGDDVAQNLLPLCGTGTTGCHGKVEHGDRQARRLVRVNLTAQQYDYIVQKKGLGWLDRHYPKPHCVVCLDDPAHYCEHCGSKEAA